MYQQVSGVWPCLEYTWHYIWELEYIPLPLPNRPPWECLAPQNWLNSCSTLGAGNLVGGDSTLTKWASLDVIRLEVAWDKLRYTRSEVGDFLNLFRRSSWANSKMSTSYKSMRPNLLSMSDTVWANSEERLSRITYIWCYVRIGSPMKERETTIVCALINTLAQLNYQELGYESPCTIF